jgi:hypothetical protein
MWQIFWQDSWWALHDSCSMIYSNCMSRASWSRHAYCSVVDCRTQPLRRSIGFGLSTRGHPKENLPTSC